MANSGQWLEELVAEIERNLLPEGFQVKNRNLIYNEDGSQIAEFDIVISGKLGTGQITWLIECRDRKSEGSAPGSWIEQLVARRDRFQFNQVTAVSTTGFSAGAIEYAREKGIELRTVEAIGYNQIETWWRAQDIDFIEHFSELKHAYFQVEESTNPEDLEIILDMIKSGHSAKIELFNPVTHHRLEIFELFQIALKQYPLSFEGTEPNLDKKLEKICLLIPEQRLRPYLVINGKQIRIERANFFREISVRHERIPIAQITEYVDTHSNQSIVQSIHYKTSVQGKNFEVRVHRYSDDSVTNITYQLSDNEDLNSQAASNVQI